MSDEITCPYCDQNFEVNHDDGTHYKDGESEPDYCPHCEKQVMIYSSCSWYHEASKADCLNGIRDHEWSSWQKLWDGELVGGARVGQIYQRRYCGVCEEEQSEWSKRPEVKS